MKVGVVTFHKALSYGACLQAYATIYLLQNLREDIDAEFVDYENEYEARQKGWKFIKQAKVKECIISIAKRVFFRNEFYKKRAFGAFHNNQPKSEISTTNRNELGKLQYDVLVAGSDQIWNATICKGIDPVFLLDFGIAKRKISFASSMGGGKLTKKEKDLFRDQLSHFYAISVREKHTEGEIKELVSSTVYQILDPTLLINKESWRQIYQKENIRYAFPKDSYILAFTIGNITDTVNKAYKFYSEKFQLPVYRIMLNSYKPVGVNKVLPGATPYEFLSLIDQAAFVITNSFHGVAFSINFNKNFVQIPVEGNNERMAELLDYVNLTDQCVGGDDFEQVPCAIDYKECNIRLEHKRKKDMEWLKRAVLDEK